jgi:hypothetical protein
MRRRGDAKAKRRPSLCPASKGKLKNPADVRASRLHPRKTTRDLGEIKDNLIQINGPSGEKLHIPAD